MIKTLHQAVYEMLPSYSISVGAFGQKTVLTVKGMLLIILESLLEVAKLNLLKILLIASWPSD